MTVADAAASTRPPPWRGDRDWQSAVSGPAHGGPVCRADVSPPPLLAGPAPALVSGAQRRTDLRRAFADLVRPWRTGAGYEVVPGRLAALRERLEQAPAHLEPARSPGFFAFEQAMAAGRFAHAVAVKGQVLGPLTLAWQLSAEGIPLVTLPVYRAAIGWYLQRLAHWQIDRLAQWGKPVLFFLDEPCLAFVPSPSSTTQEGLVAVLHDLLAALRRPGVLLGVHTCAHAETPSQSCSASATMMPSGPRM